MQDTLSVSNIVREIKNEIYDTLVEYINEQNTRQIQNRIKIVISELLMKKYLQGFTIFKDIKCEISQNDSCAITIDFSYKGILINLDRFLNYFEKHNLPLREEFMSLKDAVKLF